MAEVQCLLVVVSLTITSAAPQGLCRVYMLGGYRELFAHAQLPVAPLAYFMVCELGQWNGCRGAL